MRISCFIILACLQAFNLVAAFNSDTLDNSKFAVPKISTAKTYPKDTKLKPKPVSKPKNVKDVVPLVIKTTEGFVEGEINKRGARVWKGLTYATPPVGSLRWSDPISPSPYPGSTQSSPYQATKFSHQCVQKNPYNGFGNSEDCLYLNIFAPNSISPKGKAGYPVLFWMHGGVYRSGSGTETTFDGTSFALKGVIVVTINYRLGIFGFLKTASMNGNYGFKDQIMALKWVQKNIASFGGDPNKVTIAGESAGAASVATLLVSPLAAGLFQQGIMQSLPSGFLFPTAATADFMAHAVYTASGCSYDDLACLRAIDATTVELLYDVWYNSDNNIFHIETYVYHNFPVIVPGGDIPLQPMESLWRGLWNHVPLLAGSNKDEGILFAGGFGQQFGIPYPMPCLEYDIILESFAEHAFPPTTWLPKVLEILAEYPCSTEGYLPLIDILTDINYFCPLRNITRGTQSVIGRDSLPVYLYEFAQANEFDCFFGQVPFCEHAACHGIDTAYTFDSFSCLDYTGANVSFTQSAALTAFANETNTMWANFVKYGDPNDASISPVWPRYYGDTEDVRVLSASSPAVVSHVKDGKCDMWDSFGYRFGDTY